MGYKPRPIDQKEIDRLTREARKLTEDIFFESYVKDSAPAHVTGSVPADPYRLNPVVPPVKLEDAFDTSALYHPATYRFEEVTRPKPFRLSTVPDLRPDGTPPWVRPPPPPPTRVPGPGRPLISPRESEWKILWNRLKSWWQRDFGPKPARDQEPRNPAADGSGSPLPQPPDNPQR